MSSDVILKLEGIASAYGKIDAVKGIDLEVERGQIVTLLGANGAGKTTTLKTISGLVRAKAGRVIFEGRDITTVVAPDAPVRILLTAAPEVRAARRAGELAGEDAEAVAAALHKRDASDSAVVDFLNAAEGVEVVDSTDLDFPQTIDAVLTVIERLRGAHSG